MESKEKKYIQTKKKSVDGKKWLPNLRAFQSVKKYSFIYHRTCFSSLVQIAYSIFRRYNFQRAENDFRQNNYEAHDETAENKNAKQQKPWNFSKCKREYISLRNPSKRSLCKIITNAVLVVVSYSKNKKQKNERKQSKKKEWRKSVRWMWCFINISYSIEYGF